MHAIRDTLVRGVMGVLGIVFGTLSAVALVIAAIVPAILGLLAFVFSPVRALVDRVRRPRAAA
jgi:hypothetical protein